MIDPRLQARPSDIYKLKPNQDYAPSGLVSDDFGILASWMMPGVQASLERGNVFEKQTMDGILDFVEQQTGVKIYRGTSFEMDINGSKIAGHPDWIVRMPNGQYLVLDAKRGSVHDASYAFQTGLYANAVASGAIQSIPAGQVAGIGTVVFDNAAEKQVVDLFNAAARGELNKSQVAAKILDGITGGRFTGNQPQELSAIRVVGTQRPTDAQLTSGIRALERLNVGVYNITGLTPEELFHSPDPVDPIERAIVKKQREAINMVVSLWAQGVVPESEAKRTVKQIMTDYDNRPLSGAGAQQPAKPKTAKTEYVSIDIETGGLIEHYGGNPAAVPIFSIAVEIHNEAGQSIGHKHWVINDWEKTRFNPEAAQAALKINRLTQDQIQSSPHTLASINTELQQMLNGRTVVGHNINAYDIPVLRSRGIQFGQSIDTMQMYQNKFGYRVSVQNLYRKVIDPNYVETHSADQDQKDQWKLYWEHLRKGDYGGRQRVQEFGNVSSMPNWTDAPADLMAALGPNARAKISPNGSQIALIDPAGNVFSVSRVTNTAAGWTINGRLLSRTQVAGNMVDNPLQYRNLYDETLAAYGSGGERGVREAFKTFYKGVENMSVVNGRAFLSPARAAQLKSAAVLNLSGKTVTDWFRDMRDLAVEMKMPELANYVFRKMDGRFMFDVFKTISAGPLSYIGRDGKAYYGSTKPGDAVKSVQQMAREFAMSTDEGRNIASIFISAGTNMPDFGVNVRIGQFSHLPEGAAYLRDTLSLYTESDKYEAIPEGHDVELLSPEEWRKSAKTGSNGKPKFAVARDKHDNSLIWLEANVSDISDVQIRRGKNNLRELGYTQRRMGDTTGGQVKVWLPLKATVSEMDFSRLNLSRPDIEMLTQLGKNSRFMAQAVLSGEFQGERFEEFTKMLEAELGRPLQPGTDLIRVDESVQSEASRRKVRIDGRDWFIKHSAANDAAIGRVAEKYLDKLSREAGWVSMNWPMTRLEYEAYKRASGKGFKLDLLSPDQEAEWERNPGQAKNLKMSFLNPLVANAMLNFGMLYSGEASMPREMVERLFNLYPESVASRLLNISKRDRQPYQDIMRARLATTGEVGEDTLTAGKRTTMTVQDLRIAMESAKGGSFVGKLKHALGKNYLVVNSSRGQFFVSGEAMTWMATPGTLDRLKEDFWHAGDDDDSTSNMDTEKQAVNASWHALESLLTGDASFSDEHAVRLFNTLYGPKGIANMPAIMRGALGAVFPSRFSTQGTYTAVPGMAPNEILVSNKKLKEMFPDASLGEINRILSGDKREIILLAQRYPDVAQAITSLPAFKLVSSSMLRKRGLPVKGNFSGIGLNQIMMETIFGDFDGDQIMAVIASAFHIDKDTGQFTSVTNEQALATAAKLSTRIKHTARAIGIYTGDDELIKGEVSLERLFQVIDDLGKTGTKMTELGQWIGTMRKMNVDEDMTAAKSIFANWATGRSRAEVIGDFMSTIRGKRQMGSSYNRFVREFTAASQVLMGGMDGEITSASDNAAYANRVSALFHQKSVDMLAFSDPTKMYVEMTERFNPFRDSRRGVGKVREETTGQEFEGTFEQATWKIVESVLGAGDEFRGKGNVNQRWAEDMARSITRDSDKSEMLQVLIGEAYAAGKLNRKWLSSVADQVRKEIFGNSLDSLLGSAGPMVAVPVATWLDRGEGRKGQAWNAAMGGFGGAKEHMTGLLSLGRNMRMGRELAKGDMANSRNSVSEILSSDSHLTSRITDTIAGFFKRLKSTGQIKTGAPGSLSPNANSLMFIHPGEESHLDWMDFMINSGQIKNYQEAQEYIRAGIDLIQSKRGEFSQWSDDDVSSVVSGGHNAIGYLGRFGKNLWGALAESGGAKAFLTKHNSSSLLGAITASGLFGSASSAASGAVGQGDMSIKQVASALAAGGGIARGNWSMDGGMFKMYAKGDYEQTENDQNFYANYIAGNGRASDRDLLGMASGKGMVNKGFRDFYRKQRDGKVGYGDIEGLWRLGVTREEQLGLYDKMLQSNYGSEFQRVIGMSPEQFGSLNHGELLRSGGITATGLQRASQIVKATGEGTVDKLMGELPEDLAQLIGDRFHGNKLDRAADKAMARGDRVIDRQRRGLPDPNYRPSDISEILKHADAVIASKRSDLPEMPGDAPAAVGGKQKFADANDLISRADANLAAGRRDPGKRYASDFNPLVAKGFIGMAERGEFSEKSLGRAMELYANGTLDAKSFDAIAGYAGVSGVGGLRARVDEARRTNEPGELGGALRGIAAGSNIGTQGAIGRVEEAFKKLGGASELLTQNLKTASDGTSKFGNLLSRLESGDYTMSTSGDQRKADRKTWDTALKAWNALSASGDVDKNKAAVAAQYGIDPATLDQMGSTFEGSRRQVDEALLGKSGGKYAGMSTLGKIGAISKELTSGFELFNLQREWNMTGGRVFGEMIPEAAKSGMAAYQASAAYGGGAVGSPTGTAGGLLSSQAGWSRAFSQAGDDAYRRYGGLLGAGSGAVGSVGGAVLPALGAGVVAGNIATMAATAFPALGPLAIPIGVGVAGTTWGIGEMSRQQAMASPTAENQLRAAMDYRRSGKDPFTYRVDGFMPGDSIFTQTTDTLNARVGDAPSRMSLGELAEKYPKFVAPMISNITKALAENENSIFSKMDPTQLAQMFQKGAAYDVAAQRIGQAVNPSDQQYTAYQAYSSITGREASQFQGLSSTMNLGPNGAAMIYSMLSKTPTAQSDMGWRQAGEQLGMYAPLAQWGVSPFEMLSAPYLEGPQAFEAQRFQAGDPYITSKVARRALAKGDKSPALAESYRRMIAYESSGLAVGSTQESVRGRYLSQNAYDTAIAKQGFDLGGGMFRPAALGNLQSAAFYTNAMRNQEQSYQMQQFGYQRQSLQRNIDYTLGRPASVSYNSMGQMVTQDALTGSFGFQEQMLGLSAGHTARMARIQAGTLNFSYNGSGQIAIQAGGLAGLGAILGKDGALGGASLEQLGQAGTQYRAFYENALLERKQVGMSRQWQREDAERQWQRGNIQLDWNAQDATIGFQRSLVQLGQNMQDLNINYTRTKTQQGWQATDIAVNANRQALSYGWNMEDLELNMRYATGRERRQIARQMDRQSISYGMDVSQTDREMKRLKEHEKWNEADFQKESARIKLREQWANQDWSKEMGRIEVRRKWLDEDLERALSRIGQQATLEDEAFNLKIKHFEEDMTWQKATHDENLAYSLAMAGIQAKQLAENKKQAVENFKQESEMQATTLRNWVTMNQLGINLNTVSLSASNQTELLAKEWGDPNSKLNLAVRDWFQGLTDSFAGKNGKQDIGAAMAGALLKAVVNVLAGVK